MTSARPPEPLERWRRELARWAVPDAVKAAHEPPPRRRAPEEIHDQIAAPPGSRSFARAREALPEGGSILDVGAGAGGASLPLAPPAGAITAVDTGRSQLEVLDARARDRGIAVRLVEGTWPRVAGHVEPAEVVTCHHVLYGVPDLAAFVTALTDHARRRVVVEIPYRHPHWPLNPLWERFHGVRRPDGPTADDAVDAIRATGAEARAEAWTDQYGWGRYGTFEELVDRVRRRLFLPPDRAGQVADGLLEVGVDPRAPRSPGTVGRRLVTIWWDGAAG